MSDTTSFAESARTGALVIDLTQGEFIHLNLLERIEFQSLNEITAQLCQLHG